MYIYLLSFIVIKIIIKLLTYNLYIFFYVLSYAFLLNEKFAPILNTDNKWYPLVNLY